MMNLKIITKIFISIDWSSKRTMKILLKPHFQKFQKNSGIENPQLSCFIKDHWHVTNSMAVYLVKCFMSQLSLKFCAFPREQKTWLIW